MSAAAAERIASIHFDAKSVDKRSSVIEHERAVAIHDLLAQNRFAPVGHATGPYDVHLGVAENRLILDIRRLGGAPVTIFGLSLTPFRRVIRDYSIVCESYYAAIGTQSLTQVEAIDMGRRAVHNEGAELLIQRLEGKVEIDQDTARRLFTLIYVLQTAGSSGLPSLPALPRILFVCTRNAVRSPIAEGLLRYRRPGGPRVASAGLVGDQLDPMAEAVMRELGVDMSEHAPRVLADLALGDFDLVISLSPEAEAALRTMPNGVRVEHWDVEDPTVAEGNRDVQLAAYRRVRDGLDKWITAQFDAENGKTP
jgi:uncharacterized protein (UPF0262 family)/protein-tyrosine-phosphatase